MLVEHLPALQVVIPLVAAPVCVLLHKGRLAWGFTTIVSWAALAVAIGLLNQVLARGVISYELGGWAPPWGIEYRVDVANAFVLLVVALISAVVLTFARESVEREVADDRIYLFYTAWLLCLAGLLGIAITGDAFNLFVFLEISSLSSYALISFSRDRRALTAAFQYLVMGTIGATFILIGVGLMYAMTGTLNMVDLAARLPAVDGTRTVQAAFAFLTVGIGIKMALFPLHGWLPNAYAYAPSAVTAFLAGTATKVAVYVWLRFFFTVFGAGFSFSTMQLDWLLGPLALLGVFVTSVIATWQNDVKRLLAYSSVAQIGYMALGISLVSVTGVTAALVHLFNHALIKTALFLVLGCIVYRVGSPRIEAMAGLGRRMPLTLAAYVVGGLSLVGVPLTVGFISKWYLILAALEQGLWPVALLVVASSLIALIYIWRVVEAAYFREPAPGALVNGDEPREAPVSLLAPTWALIAANVYFGLDTSVTVGVATRAAQTLLGAGS
ncbi:MAG: monovalent cation/H+ antiporter subunit D family protein [Gammaproteobacteria bacterium]|nr:monovalent cation/H+ antiporter subunit D family protein [Gammaproteobacteria bacterium]NIR84440.1 monovalent cation/H+ antiporter subunit D family protein [Gammaproteobacteria bacterium]NIR90921.1 monovalent cation/H+ antiporter subunit D family protein [Gammaproteobacteria bacterium]NIU07107.1 monovalent cation/H+ antiporter subunit D family protein [Gammaproteobacteria bacterium]NIV76236.1 monovalent cation/H+ antiporter subunit D family protein [Gammaproteobacteria bacterium]